MNELLDSAYWCVLQVTVVIAFGLLLAGHFSRRRPDQAGTVICVTLIAVSLLTVIAPLPFQRAVSWFSTTTGDTLVTAEAKAIQPLAIREHENLSYQPPLSIRWTQLTSFARSIAQQATVPRKNAWSSLTMAAWFSAIALLIGVIRLAISLHFLVRTRRGSDPVMDQSVCEQTAQLAAKIGCLNVPQLYESPDLRSAAVVGPFKPTVVLPRSWREWSNAELAAVLAHELAHIARADATWRLLACCVQAVHFFNPLAHLLLNRFALMQELAADDTAAGVIGRRNYLKSLSQLALRRDQNRGQGCPAVLPVFTGHLKRRIEMLRSTDGNHCVVATGSRRRIVWPVVVMFVLCTSVVSLREIAAADDKAKQSTKATPISASKPVEKKSTYSLSSGFQRAPISTSVIGPNETGYVGVRVSELLAHPIIKPYASMVNPSMLFPEMLPSSIDPEGIDINQVESVIAQAMVSLDNDVQVDNDHNNRLMLGANGCVIQLTKKVELKSWVKSYFPVAKPVENENLVTFEVPVGDAAPIPFLVQFQQNNSRSIKLGWQLPGQPATEDLFPVLKPSGSGNIAHVQRAWNSVSGGLAAIVCSDADMRSSIEVGAEGSDVEIAVSRLSASLVEHCSCAAYGFDLNEAGDVLIQIRLTHDSASQAKLTVGSIQELKILVKKELQDFDDPEERAMSELAVNWLDDASIKTQSYDDLSCDVVMHSQLPLAAVLKLVKSNEL